MSENKAAWDDFRKHGGSRTNITNRGKTLMRCCACPETMYVFPSALDRAGGVKCPACGWPMDRSARGVKGNADLHKERRKANATDSQEPNKRSKRKRRALQRGGG